VPHTAVVAGVASRHLWMNRVGRVPVVGWRWECRGALWVPVATLADYRPATAAADLTTAARRREERG